jgi:hypothetical protein
MEFEEALGAFFHADALAERGERLAHDYTTASPFPHIAIDGLFPDDLLDGLLESLEEPGAVWRQFSNKREIKHALASDEDMPPRVQAFIYKLNSAAFLRFLEKMTGIEGLIPDPHLTGGGIHHIKNGGFLKVHADFNRHETMGVDRRLNLLVYLNKDWPEEYGGHLELWDEEIRECKERHLPLFNRSVVFSTTDTSFHGHPDPVNCPPDRARQSIAMYYYTAGRPAAETSDKHSTLFVERPGEDLQETFMQRIGGIKGLVKLLVPPILTRSGRSRLR